jgi:hypothetical protein
VEKPVQPADEAALGRLRHAIAAEDEDDEEEQLKGVLRMLAERSPTRLSSPRFVGEREFNSGNARADSSTVPRLPLARRQPNR